MADHDPPGDGPDDGRGDGGRDGPLGVSDGRPAPARRPTLVIAPDGRVYLRRDPAPVVFGTTAGFAHRAS